MADELENEAKHGEFDIEAPREVVDLEHSEEGADGGYGESESNPTESDLKATLRRLFPHFPVELLDRVAQAVMVGRVAPDVFLDMIYLTVTSCVEDMDIDGSLVKNNISVQDVINLVYTAYSIGLEGKGRFDALELAGAVKESEELDKLSKGLGIN